VIFHGKETPFLSTGSGVVEMQGRPQQDVDAHERGQHALHVLDRLSLSSTELLDGFEIDIGNVLDLDLESTTLFFDGNTGTRVRIRERDGKFVDLGFSLRNGVGSEEVLAAIVGTRRVRKAV
jgi:hypothetical protein